MKSPHPRGDRSLRFLLVAACVLAASADASRAAVGDLAPLGCIEETGGSVCAHKTAGLSGSAAVATSHDGDSVYVASFDDDAIATFERASNGSLSSAGCFQNTGGTDCNGSGGTAPGLDGATEVAVSPDGKSVYVVSTEANAMAIFSRATDGSLTSAGCVQDDAANTICKNSGETPGLRSPSGVAVSPDGKNVYVAAFLDDGIVAFARASNGTLTSIGCIQNTGGTDCTASGGTTPGLDGAYDVTVSPDGKNVYVASYLSDAIVIFDRAANGALTPAGCIQDTGGIACADNAPALDGPRAVAVSPGGTSVYVASLLDDAIVTFDRDPDGSLTEAGCIQNTGGTDCSGVGGTTPGLLGASSVVVSADGESVYVASLLSSALAAFDRGSDGSLSKAGCIQDSGLSECTDAGGTTTAGLEGAVDAAVSADGTSVYVASFSSAAVVAFDRDSSTPSTTVSPAPDCGDVNDSGTVTSVDALAILKAAVGGNECDEFPCVCDVAGGGSILSSDAQRALRIAVGHPIEPLCPC